MVTEAELTRLVPERLGRIGTRLLGRGAVPVAVIALNRGRQGVRWTLIVPSDATPEEINGLRLLLRAGAAQAEEEFV